MSSVRGSSLLNLCSGRGVANDKVIDEQAGENPVLPKSIVHLGVGSVQSPGNETSNLQGAEFDN